MAACTTATGGPWGGAAVVAVAEDLFVPREAWCLSAGGGGCAGRGDDMRVQRFGVCSGGAGRRGPPLSEHTEWTAPTLTSARRPPVVQGRGASGSAPSPSRSTTSSTSTTVARLPVVLVPGDGGGGSTTSSWAMTPADMVGRGGMQKRQSAFVTPSSRPGSTWASVPPAPLLLGMSDGAIL